ncbi:MAG: hypothetical protein L0H37_01125 [Nitrosospira sp.]|nr:hypothetical protein [Nitrosospira sp.]
MDSKANPESQALELLREAEAYREVAHQMCVTTPGEYSSAADELRGIKARLKELDEREKAITRPINASLRDIRALFKRPKNVLESVEREIKAVMVDYDREQERARRTEQAKLEAAARKERERLAERARKAEESGRTEKSAQLEMQAQSVVAPIAQEAKPKVEGISYRERWTFEITDQIQLPREYLMPDEKRIGQVVRAMKGDACIPGVTVRSVREVAARSA